MFENSKLVLAGWGALALLLVFACGAVLLYGDRFDWEIYLKDIPTLPFAIMHVIVGVIFVLAVVPLIYLSRHFESSRVRNVLYFVVGIGVLLRIALVFGTPILEDDFYRYLWDGGVVVHGYNPYAYAPGSVDRLDVPGDLTILSIQARQVHERINHEDLKTIYPPVSQAAFALAHLIHPWDMVAWRAVCFGAELVSLGLILLLLRELSRSPLWVALYWLNPLVVKETINSAHTEAVLVPMVLGMLLAFLTKRYFLAVFLLGLGVGAKLWPILLAPLVLRPLVREPLKLLGAVSLLGGLCILWALPPYIGGLDDTSGFVAFATHWQTNSALYPTLERATLAILAPFNFADDWVSRGLRGVMALIVGVFAVGMSIKPIADNSDFVRRVALVVTALVILSPAQFPWYVLWVLPLMPLYPVWAMIAASALVPMYYSSFYFMANDTYDIFKWIVVWGIWLPVWILLVWQFAQTRFKRFAAA